MSVSVDQFVQQLGLSTLMTADDVQELLQKVPSEQHPKDGEQLARLLVGLKKISAFQAQQLYKGKGKSLVLGNYLVVDKLGQGGMGVVFKAIHRRMKRVVAVKVLSPALTKNPDVARRFQREVEAAAKLEHPNIVTAYDADEASGIHFLVSQFIDGVDLSQLIRQQHVLSPEKAVRLIIQTARGLEFAHSRGVVHRDIKPSNLLLDKEGVVKILDMGLARLESGGADQDQLTGTGQIMGTVDYMAPEQALDTRNADGRADIYSLGITLWYLMAGRPAFDGDTMMAKLLAHRERPAPSLREAAPNVSAELDAIFTRMVAKSPSDRFQSMTEVIAALERCLDPAGKADHSETIIVPDLPTRDSAASIELVESDKTENGQAKTFVTATQITPPVKKQGAVKQNANDRERTFVDQELQPQGLVVITDDDDQTRPLVTPRKKKAKADNRKTIWIVAALVAVAGLVGLIFSLSGLNRGHKIADAAKSTEKNGEKSAVNAAAQKSQSTIPGPQAAQATSTTQQPMQTPVQPPVQAIAQNPVQQPAPNNTGVGGPAKAVANQAGQRPMNAPGNGFVNGQMNRRPPVDFRTTGQNLTPAHTLHVYQTLTIDFPAERKVAEWLKSISASCVLVDTKGMPMSLAGRDLPATDFFVQSVDLSRNPNVTDADVGKLAQCHRLAQISFVETPQITDDVVLQLAKFPVLSDIRINRCPKVTGTLAKKLSQCQHLRFLSVTMTDADVSGLVAPLNLESFDLSTTSLTERGLEELARVQPNILRLIGGGRQEISLRGLVKFQNLESLMIAETQLTDEVADVLAELPNLRRLETWLPRAPGTFQRLTKVKQITSLQLNNSSAMHYRVSDAEFDALFQLPLMNSLTMHNISPSDAVLVKFAGLKELRSLTLDIMRPEMRTYTEKGVKEFQALRPDVFCIISGFRPPPPQPPQPKSSPAQK